MVQVKVNEGILEGEILDSILGYKYHSFKGIPYAEPPIGEFRFKAPRPLKPWVGVKQAKKHGPVCTQFDSIFHKKLLDGSEDCLYLNVYTKDIKPKQPLPVMVWIHGGGFKCGSGNSDITGPDFLIEKDVIFVTFNYRLEVLGFLCLDTKEVPGNAGMKDQVAALKWVKNNIQHFGGDPNNITVFGESAGAASVAFHLVSPMSKNLFNKAILQSGSHFSPWANCLNPVDVAFATAKELGKDTNDIKELFDFFMSEPCTKLININAKLMCFEETRPWINLKYGVVEEKDFGQEIFFNGNKYDIHENVEIIAGYTANECALMTAMCMLTKNLVEKCNKLSDVFVPDIMTWKLTPLKQIEVSKKIKKFYFNDTQVNDDDLIILSNYFSLEFFKLGVLQFIKLCVFKKLKVYMFNFNCVSNRNLSVKEFQNMGVVLKNPICVHGDDLGYIFTNEFDNPSTVKENGWNMIQNTVNLFTNFAKHGNPTSEDTLGAKWVPFTLEKQEYLVINEQLTLRYKPEDNDWQFWDEIFEQYLPEYFCLNTKS